MNDIFRFREFPVYKDALQFRNEVKALSKEKFPVEEKYCLRPQLWRALDSIILNIAEGSDRYSDVDFSRFLNNSLTSVNEAIACLECALGDGYVNEEEFQQCSNKAEALIRQLKAFSAKIRNK